MTVPSTYKQQVSGLDRWGQNTGLLFIFKCFFYSSVSPQETKKKKKLTEML